MLRFLTGADLRQFPILGETMFRDRAAQFRDRLDWAVQVDDLGRERDAYDRLNPIYVVWQRQDGRHGGSMRFLPTLGRTMVNDHFAHLAGGRRIGNAKMWECTRFCLAADAGPNLSAALMLGAAQLGVGFGLSRAVGVFDARMVRIYRQLGWEPVVLGSTGQGGEAVSLGIWEFSEAIRRRMAARAGMSPDIARLWFDRAFGAKIPGVADG